MAGSGFLKNEYSLICVLMPLYIYIRQPFTNICYGIKSGLIQSVVVAKPPPRVVLNEAELKGEEKERKEQLTDGMVVQKNPSQGQWCNRQITKFQNRLPTFAPSISLRLLLRRK